ncbi:pyruvate ferredoxin oxidoreductase [Eggerthellaceae bacterium zg-1084]|uniref:2-oxoacid:acceptor oxidoreductase family protein n=1 Tax=Berryella wangjianweii TaxID=2734634 RepID=UPI001555A758|nr:2-oxoacid:acceptor oxidoreductase family protein [Berryella wangjianweii]NPD30967.1 pyruvate ferredoxin oxidoreductase [Berryella wangjianweii]
MLDVLLTGVGGQGTVLAAKLLAQAAEGRGWAVRTAETIGMAQRGGNVVSHVRMAGAGQHVSSPLLPRGSADLIVAFEPIEAARTLVYLGPRGVLVSARSSIQPLAVALDRRAAVASNPLDMLQTAFGQCPQRLVLVDDERLLQRVGSRKALNVVLLACALAHADVPLGLDDLRQAVRACVRPRFVDMNLHAIDVVEESQAALRGRS